MKKLMFSMAVLFGLYLASCGGSGPVTTIDVVLTDFQFTPNTFTIPAGQEITFTARNNGAVVHTFVILNLGAEAGSSFDKSDAAKVYWQAEVKPNDEASTTFTAPTEPGEYQVVCSVEGHTTAGMVGKLIVVDGE